MSQRIVSVASYSSAQPSTSKEPEDTIFQEEIQRLMYAFGDEEHPNKESAYLVECYMIEHLKDVLFKALSRSTRKGASQLQLEDILHVLKNHPKQYNRVKGLMSMMEEQEEAKGSWIEELEGKKKRKLKD